MFNSAYAFFVTILQGFDVFYTHLLGTGGLYVVLTCLHSPIGHWGVTMWFWCVYTHPLGFWRVYTHPFGTGGIIMWLWRVYTHPLGSGGLQCGFDVFTLTHWGSDVFTLTHLALGDYNVVLTCLHSPIGVLMCLHSPIGHWGDYK